jgi:hypothetical protein
MIKDEKQKYSCHLIIKMQIKFSTLKCELIII